MKIASWNVNSIRVRQNQIIDWLEEESPDVLCLQEIKVTNNNFPKEIFEEKGWHIYTHGQKTYNGVAFISKHKLHDIEYGFSGTDLDNQARVITAMIAKVRLVNIYAPQGESPDSPKFDFKRRWYLELNNYLKNHKNSNILICGDFNIAPEDKDVDNPEKRANNCMFLPIEHEWLKKIMGLGMVDTFRQHNQNGGQFSWWDYRQNGFIRGQGMRIDHIIVTKELAKRCISAGIDPTPRGNERPSDHTPVWAVFE